MTVLAANNSNTSVGEPEKDAGLATDSFDVAIKKIINSGVIVNCPDGSEGWLPAAEWSYDRREWVRDRNNLTVGKLVQVIKWGKTLNDGRLAVSKRRAAYNPWRQVTKKWIGQAKQLVVTRLTKNHAIGDIEPGLEAKLMLKPYYRYIEERDPIEFWKSHASIALGDYVGGMVIEIQEPNNHDEPTIILDPVQLFKRLEDDPSFLVNQSKDLVPLSNSTAYTSGYEIHERAPNIEYIFILDNDVYFLKAMEDALTISGYQVVTASSEDEARAILKGVEQGSIHLALIDIHLQDDLSIHDGLKIARHIADICPYCKIILVSAEDFGPEHNKKTPRKFADSNGLEIVAYIQKPLTIAQLHEEIGHAAASQPKRLETFLNPNILETDVVTTLSNTVEQNKKDNNADGRFSIEKAVENLGNQLENVVVHVFQMHPVTTQAKSIAHYGEALRWETFKHKLGKSPVSDTAIASNRAFWIDHDVNANAHLQGKHFWLLKAMNYRSALGIPICAQSDYAYCLLAFHPDTRAFTPEFESQALLCAERVGRSLTWNRLMEISEERSRYLSAGMAFVCLSHELSTDLTGLSAEALMLKESLQKTVKGSTMDASAVEAAARLEAGINRAITIAQTLGGIKSRSVTESLNIIDCLTEAVKAVRTQIPREKEIEVRLVPCKIEYKVRSVRSRLVPALFNLLLNAVQQISLFVRKKGLIWVEVKPVTLDDSGNWLQININDTGPGIHSADFERVFQAGFSTKPDGTGMGLHICRYDITGIRDGSRPGRVVVAKSTLCIGTIFSVYLPALDAERKEK